MIGLFNTVSTFLFVSSEDDISSHSESESKGTVKLGTGDEDMKDTGDPSLPVVITLESSESVLSSGNKRICDDEDDDESAVLNSSLRSLGDVGNDFEEYVRFIGFAITAFADSPTLQRGQSRAGLCLEANCTARTCIASG
jgi:hypothetical protein